MFKRSFAIVGVVVLGVWLGTACGAETAIIGVSTNGDTIEFQVIQAGGGGIPATVSQLTLEVGESVDILVSVLNPLATPVPAGQVTWQSDDPTVAAVTAGTITGVAEGSTTVYASALGVSAAMPVQVVPVATTQPPPAPGSFRQNMPAGWTILTENAMDIAPPPTTAYYENQPIGDGWTAQYWGAIGGGMQQTVDPTAPMSPDFVLEEIFPPGLSGSGVNAIHRTLPATEKVYLSWVVKWDADFDHNGTSEKLIWFNLGTPFVRGDIWLFQMHWGREAILNITPEVEIFAGQSSLYANVSPHGVNPIDGIPITPWIDGEWVEFEFLFDSATGEVRWWRNGVLHANHQGRTFKPIERITLDSTWGGGGNKQGTHSRYTDHVTIAIGS